MREITQLLTGTKKTGPEAVMEITQLLSDYIAPGTADSGYREAARLLQFKHTTRTRAENFARFDSLRRNAASKMQVAGACPETVAPVPRIQNATLSRHRKSPELRRVHVNFGILRLPP